MVGFEPSLKTAEQDNTTFLCLVLVNGAVYSMPTLSTNLDFNKFVTSATI